jgi:hypothetical protein
MAEIDRYNEAVGLANAGQDEQALERLDALTASCQEPTLCAAADSLRKHLRDVARYNAAVDLANAGKREAAITALEALERETEDAEALERVRSLLRDLEARR